MDEIFQSAARSAGDLAGVFEFDGETSYFYLYNMSTNGAKVIDAIKIGVGSPEFKEEDIEIVWCANDDFVFLKIAGTARAVFDCIDQRKYGGVTMPADRSTQLPPELLKKLYQP